MNWTYKSSLKKLVLWLQTETFNVRVTAHWQTKLAPQTHTPCMINTHAQGLAGFEAFRFHQSKDLDKNVVFLCYYDHLTQRCTNPALLVAQTTKFCAVAPTICVGS